MREAMGAFGKAIDPKTLGLNAFKKKFADADWTKPETYMEAGKFMTEFAPEEGIQLTQQGMQLAASLKPKVDRQLIDVWNSETQSTDKKLVDVNAQELGTTFAGKPVESSAPVSGAALNAKLDTDKFDPNAMYTRNKTGGLTKIGGTGTPTSAAGTPAMQNAMALFPNNKKLRDKYIKEQTAIKPDASSTPADTADVKNAKFLYPNDPVKQKAYVVEQTDITKTAAVDAAQAFLSTSDPDKYTGPSMNAFVASIEAKSPDYSLLDRYEEMTPKGEAVLLAAQDTAFQALNKAGRADALADKLNPDELVQSAEGEQVKASLSAGWVASAETAIKDFFGSQDEISEIRTEFTKIKNLEIIGNLPPGVASDKDIEIVSAGFPDANANPKVLYNWLKSYANIQRADAEFNRFKAAYISKNNNSKGFMGDWKKYSKVPVGMLEKYRSSMGNSGIDNDELNKVFTRKFGFNPAGLL